MAGQARLSQVSTTKPRVQAAKPCGKVSGVTRYTQKDIKQTGQTDVGQALRQLDPRFR
jgi:hypothetical protein